MDIDGYRWYTKPCNPWLTHYLPQPGQVRRGSKEQTMGVTSALAALEEKEREEVEPQGHHRREGFVWGIGDGFDCRL